MSLIDYEADNLIDEDTALPVDWAALDGGTAYVCV
jgi:hypothetical protein